jgi:flagellar P-ring protein precursor FlgI
VTGERYASQPSFIDGFAKDIRSLTVTNTRLDVDEGTGDAVVSFPNTSVTDLVEGLSRARVNTRRIIAILQAIKAAGALHAELIIQ